MDTRDRMLDAAAHVMRTRGLARVTTKEIAKEAGYSEAALYKHFRDKKDLLLVMLTEHLPSTFGSLLADLDPWVGCPAGPPDSGKRRARAPRPLLAGNPDGAIVVL